MASTVNNFKNPHRFKLVWDSTTKVEPVPNSQLICIGLACSSNQYYAALVDPTTFKNYVLYANITNKGVKFGTAYKDIPRTPDGEREHAAISDFFLKVGVFEYYYKGRNWEFKRKDNEDVIPDWFSKRYFG